jgi:hypothetical protein
MLRKTIMRLLHWVSHVCLLQKQNEQGLEVWLK